jgi:hypothetical protein
MIVARYPPSITQCVRKVAVHLGYGNEDFVGSIEVAAEVILLYQNFYECGAAKSAVYRDRPHTFNGLKSVFIRNISHADLQKVLANKIKWVQACIDAGGHHFQQLS